ncbi:MAG: hypothetical protein NZ529_04120 [Cytophagaceae bacterium]|nr:hypothetical protein [Cytophagaceae bacterium]MDW8455959.1 hypothetical protein [Cytophagaceae bacterium]
MFNSQILDVAIGMAVIYLFQSILISGLNELIVMIFSLRRKILKFFIRNAFKADDQSEILFTELERSPFISYCRHKKKFPPEISPNTFTDAIIETLSRDMPAGRDIYEYVKEKIFALPPSQFKRILNAKINECSSLSELRTEIEEWFSTYMTRLTDWYKKRVQIAIYVLSFITTIALNVDSFSAMNELWRNEKLRESVIAFSAEIIKKEYEAEYKPVNDADSTELAFDRIIQDYQKLSILDFPITWEREYKIKNGIHTDMSKLTLMQKLKWSAQQMNLEKCLGFLITTMAVSIGAPMWYDVLKKLMKIREGMKKNNNDATQARKEDE